MAIYQLRLGVIRKSLIYILKPEWNKGCLVECSAPGKLELISHRKRSVFGFPKRKIIAELTGENLIVSFCLHEAPLYLPHLLYFIAIS